MACKIDGETAGFTFTWTLENVPYFWQKTGEAILSPPFIAYSKEGGKWRLWMYLKGFRNVNSISFRLGREEDCDGADVIDVDYELALLAADGTTLKSDKYLRRFAKGMCPELFLVTNRSVVFCENAKFPPQDVLTARCRMLKSNGKVLETGHCFARTTINIKRTSFIWDIYGLSDLAYDEKRTYVVRSATEGILLTLSLFLTGGQCFSDKINIGVESFDETIRYLTFACHLLDVEKNKVICGQYETRLDDSSKSEKFPLLLTRKILMENSSMHWPADVLTLLLECTFSTGIAFEGIERFDIGMVSPRMQIEDVKSVHNCSTEEEKFDASIGIKADLKTLHSSGLFCDMKLRTSTETFPVHKSILSARSPVFLAMFTSGMKENSKECVDIPDLDADTVRRMLAHVYSDTLEDLQWENASQLYVAADKYEMLLLKSKCLSILKASLSPSNACEILVVADLHQDEDLKKITQDFIVSRGTAIFSSNKWKLFMDANLKLAAETMFLKCCKN